MSKFGWSMPAGVWESTLPGEELEPIPPRCGICGAFLPNKPDETESWEDLPHAAGHYLVWTCRRCHRKVCINDMDFDFYTFDGRAWPIDMPMKEIVRRLAIKRVLEETNDRTILT